MILENLKDAKSKSKKRKFSQTWDLLINLAGLDLKKPENRFNVEFALPEGRGKDVKVAVFADSVAAEAKKHADHVIRKEEIESLAKNKKKVKKLAKEYDWFLAEAPLMPLIGKTLGPVLAPRGRMPKPVPPKGIDALVQLARRSIRIALKTTPVIQVPVGTEAMPDEKVMKNIESVYNFIRDKLPKGKTNIRNVFIKVTMGQPVKVEMK